MSQMLTFHTPVRPLLPPGVEICGQGELGFPFGSQVDRCILETEVVLNLQPSGLALLTFVTQHKSLWSSLLSA